LQHVGVRLWLDEEQIKPDDSIPAKIEDGLEHSRVLVLCMSAHVFLPLPVFLDDSILRRLCPSSGRSGGSMAIDPEKQRRRRQLFIQAE
jgi:hypothetical protein